MNYSLFKTVANTLYSMVFRSLLKKAIDDPEETWDDDVLRMCDAFFNYTEK